MDGGLGCLGLSDHLANVRQLGPRANGGCADDQGTRGVEGSTGHRTAGGYFARKRFARHQRGIQRAGALFDDAVGGDLVSRAHLEAIAHGQLRGRNGAVGALAAASFNEDCILCTELKKRTQGITGVVARPCLHQATGKEESDDRAGALKVDFRVRRVAARGNERHLHAHAKHPCTTKNEGVPRP